MSIRYNKDNVRATNGPLIFFSDASSKEGFAEEVRGALISGLSFYAYRLPGDFMISYGSSEGFVEGIKEAGFVIGTFDTEKQIITIPYRGINKPLKLPFQYHFPNFSTSYDDYCSELDEIINKLKFIPYGKVVAARVKIIEEPLDLADTFFYFCRKFPDCMIFCFSTPATGCWIGASPELLLEGNGKTLNTMALAGTRLSSQDTKWDSKNIEEQKIVTDYIGEVFKSNGLLPRIEKAYTKKSGNIEHICTPISTEILDEDFSLLSLLKNLAPTPALCGYPKNIAYQVIKENEKFDRGCYGGFCGPFHSINNFHFNVIIRCSAVEQLRYCVYAGGGITSASKIEEEWEETELKIHNTFGLK